jgi:hypothetical protein
VRHALVITAFLIGTALARPSAETIGVESALHSAGALAVKFDVDEGDALFSIACLDSAALLEGQCAESLAVSLSLPWMRIGVLSPTGILREAQNPLAYSAASQVFMERAGLALEASEAAATPGILCMPVPDALGLFCVPGPGGVPSFGCFGACEPLASFSLDGFATVSQPDAADPGEEWFFTSPPFPGGALVVSAARLSCRLPPVSASASAGISFGERVPPGGYFHLDCQAAGKNAHGALLFGGRDGTYRTAAGKASPAALSWAGSAGVQQPAGSVDIAYSCAVELSAFAPRPFMRSTEHASVTLEKELLRGTRVTLSCRVSAEKGLSFDGEGRRDDTARFLGSATAEGKGFQANAGFEMAVPGASQAEPSSQTILFSVDAPRISRVVGGSLEARLDFRPGGAELSAVLTFAFSRVGESVRLAAGVTNYPLRGSAGGTDSGGNLVLKVGWSTQSVTGR